MRFATLSSLACSLAVASAVAGAYPDRPVTLVVPFPAGGPTDIVGRVVAQGMAGVLGQPVVVENRSGAAGQIGATAVARSKPDGYLIGLATVSTHGTVPNVMAAVPYDAVKDFTPVSNLASSPMALSVHPGTPAQSLKDLVGHVRANPGKLAYASAGSGGIGDLGMTWFLQIIGGQVVGVGYKGSAPALADVISGQVPMTFDNLPSTLVYVRSGKLRALAVTGAQRHPSAPDLPTFAEQGYPQFNVSAWYGLLGPAGLRPEVVARLHDAVVKTIADPAVVGRLANAGAYPIGNRPEQFGEQIREEIDRWARVIRTAGIKPQ